MVHKEFMSKRELARYEKMENEVELLNEKFAINEEVKVKKDDGNYEQDFISSPFSIMSGQVVAWLEKNRCYLAERVEKL